MKDTGQNTDTVKILKHDKTVYHRAAPTELLAPISEHERLKTRPEYDPNCMAAAEVKTKTFRLIHEHDVSEVTIASHLYAMPWLPESVEKITPHEVKQWLWLFDHLVPFQLKAVNHVKHYSEKKLGVSMPPNKNFQQVAKALGRDWRLLKEQHMQRLCRDAGQCGPKYVATFKLEGTPIDYPAALTFEIPEPKEIETRERRKAEIKSQRDSVTATDTLKAEARLLSEKNSVLEEQSNRILRLTGLPGTPDQQTALKDQFITRLETKPGATLRGIASQMIDNAIDRLAKGEEKPQWLSKKFATNINQALVTHDAKIPRKQKEKWIESLQRNFRRAKKADTNRTREEKK